MPHPLLFYQNAWKHTTGEGVDRRDIYIQMTIPNEEIAYIYENHISLWFEKKIKGADLSPLMIALSRKTVRGRYMVKSNRESGEGRQGRKITGQSLKSRATGIFRFIVSVFTGKNVWLWQNKNLLNVSLQISIMV